MSDAVLYEVKGKAAIATINKPKANQLSLEVFNGLNDALNNAARDKSLRSLIITGSGDKIFCAGADLTGGFGPYSPIDFLKMAQDVFNKIEFMPIPVIAAMNGHAFGGGLEMAMACHLRILKVNSRIGLTETNLGIMPGYGGTLRLPRLIGRAKAIECILTGAQIPSEEALSMGLVNHLAEEGQTLAKALEMAEVLSGRPPLAVKAILRVMAQAASISPDLHLQHEREELAKLFETKDTMEGMMAFAQKRPAVFIGE
ncbi:MAG: enoyl-CoA hydratase/isomerase family protein [Deltaproteobacteria bacterium]|nr:enoyl-CoA hydratase/isomerase family protein [Deltaproteobacteria bacterium]